MNAVEIEEAVSALAERPFDAEEFPFAFLEAFGNKEATLKRLRTGESNKSDLGGVLQTNNIHIATSRLLKFGTGGAGRIAIPCVPVGGGRDRDARERRGQRQAVQLREP